ncbi:MAG: DEAD/DEAH box helicase [Candidatus Hadarchaeota archaeon]|nr:DEAD/DEAH box helicase [Candidatus Hadarchaeota archaeon]
MPRKNTVFDLLVKPLRKLLAERGFDRPTLPQEKAIPHVLEGKNVLLIAPAGTGKTEAAFLPVLHRLLEQPRQRGIKVVYITPLRALNRDMLDRLRWWCRALDLKISVRHGDTAIRERRKQALSPPDVLITTPETLQLVLVGRRLSRALSMVRWVIIDEVHELADNKRGAQLSLSLERLHRLKGSDFQVVGLSATIGTPREVAKFLVGVGRRCKVVDVTVARKIRLDVIYPKVKRTDKVLASDLYTYPEVAARLRAMRKLIESHGSTLVFTNTRPMTEILASRFRIWDLKFPVSIHHGSLSSFARLRTEQGLKSGELKGAICTSSMELGLDIGGIDLCIQYNSPRQVTRLLQRVGRSGHRITGVAKGVVVVQNPSDALESMVIAARSKEKNLEPVKIPEKPLDVLAHGLVAMLVSARQWRVGEVHELVKRAYPFRNLSKEELLGVLRFMQSIQRKLTWLPPEEDVFVRPRRGKRVFDYYFGNLSMIPDLKQYLVVDDVRNEPVGILDESFIAEYGDPGAKFIIGGSIWKIVQVFRNKVFVKPDDDPLGAVPTWVGEEIPVPYSVAQEAGRVRQEVEKLAKRGLSFDEISKELSKKYGAKKGVIKRTLGEAYKQVEQGLPVPTHDRITIEKCGDTHVVHACFGTLMNRTLARFIAHQASEELGESVAISVDPYQILLRSKELSLEELTNILKGKLGGDFQKALKTIIEGSKFFKWRIVQVARRMGVLERETEITSKVVDKLMRGLKGTPAYEETFKEVVYKDLDLDRTLEILEKVKAGKLDLVSHGVRKKPTPLSSSAWKRRSLAFESVSPERLRKLIMASVRARLLSEVRTLVCTKCGKYVEVKRVHELEERPKCPKCGSTSIGLIEREPQEVWRILELLDRAPEKGGQNKIWKEIKEVSKLISRYGKVAAIALVGRGITPSEAGEILEGEDRLSDKFLELVLRKEREALLQRYKWG